ncbi:MAG: hypothetical protein IH623_29190 [Verrucomicrobia bacterium]|nr:hypothetical protein [Verrucomicrobiota bacterium]
MMNSISNAQRTTGKHKRPSWFEVDKQGLAQILERKGKEFTLFELVQNAWDEPGVTTVNVTLEVQGRNRARLVVEDDAPDGFKDLSHAFTLFAESAKKANPEQRGRFNLGEKLVLAISDEVTISTARGGVRFDAEGRRRVRSQQSVGSRIECLLRLTPGECDAIAAQARKLIPPAQIVTSLNHEPLPPRLLLEEFRATLPTETGDTEDAKNHLIEVLRLNPLKGFGIGLATIATEHATVLAAKRRRDAEAASAAAATAAGG